MLKAMNLKAGYNGQAVIDVPALELKTKERCLISGPSGSGKTTLLCALAGIGNVMQGSVVIDGKDLYALSEGKRDCLRGEKIGIVFQTLHLVKSLSVLDNLLLAPFMTRKKQDKAVAEALLEKLGLADLKDRSAAELSQGQAQRVALARALMNKPAVILADEPTSALDDRTCDRVMASLASAARETGAVLVVASHDARIKKGFDREIALGGRT